MKILIASGGSGGHIFPAVALAEALKRKGDSIAIKFIGSNKALDRRIFEKEHFDYSLLSANRLPYRISWDIFIFCLKLVLDFIKSFLIILSYRPNVAVGFGGYVSGAVMYVSHLLKIPTIAHEQNVAPGRANRLAFKFADKMAVRFEETITLRGPYGKKAIFTGNPIRSSIYKHDKDSGKAILGLDKEKFTILIIGGSQGAHFLNKTFIMAISKMDENTKRFLQVIHITGLKDYEWASLEYNRLGLTHRVYSFIDRIEEAYSAADLIVTRSGASAIFEIAFFGKPMILIPYPFALSHQLENARVFSEKGAAIEMEESSISDELFKNNILNLLNNRHVLTKMAECANRISMPDASERLAGHVLSLAGKR